MSYFEAALILIGCSATLYAVLVLCGISSYEDENDSQLDDYHAGAMKEDSELK